MAAPLTMDLPPCPTCAADEGAVCRRPSGHEAWPAHAPRLRVAEKLLAERGYPEGLYEFLGSRCRITLVERY